MLLKEKIDIVFIFGFVVDGVVINRLLLDLKLIWCKSIKVNIEYDVKKMFLSNFVFSFFWIFWIYWDMRVFVYGMFSFEILVFLFFFILVLLGLVEVGLGVVIMFIYVVR